MQLAVKDDVASDARVVCPTCHKEFELTQSVLRPIPEAVPVVRNPAASAPTVAEIEMPHVQSDVENDMPLESHSDEIEPASDAASPADDEHTADFHASETVPELESKSLAEELPLRTADEDEYEPKVAPRPATLAELMKIGSTQDNVEVPGPSFDLPNVPLVRENGGTVEFDSIREFGVASNTEFELDDVDFEIGSTPSQNADISQPHTEEPEFASTATVDAPAYEQREFPDASVVVGPPPRRRRRSPLRILVGTVLGGFLGLSVGYYLLMYLLGPRGDFLEVAQYIPSRLLPASFASRAADPPIADSPTLPRVEIATTIPHASEDETNVPASYVDSTPELPANANPTEEFDHYEPSEFDEALAEPLMNEPTSEITMPLPFDGPSYSSTELESALAAAKLAQAGLVDGDLSDIAVRRTKGLSYAKLCDLAQTYVFFDRSSDAPSDLELQSRAAQLFAETLAGAHTRDEVARIAPIWIDSPHRRHGGVFLAGTIGDGQIAGDVYEYELTTVAGGTYAVLSALPIESPPDAIGESVVVVGTIVDLPADKVSGYDGNAERAIWAAWTMLLE
jgi:hypothetical protein